MNVYGLTIKEIHEGLKNGSINIHEYYESLINEAKFQQDRLNCFVNITEEHVQKMLDGFSFDENDLLSGIPFVSKDNYSTKGIETTASSRMLEHYKPIYNATVINKLESHNCMMIAKASMDELAMGGTNKSALTGPVSNPYNLECISGGSSGGSAASVASGLIPFALGSDTGDSIRKPASYCGIVGFKPTWGLISRYGVIPYASSLDHVGAFTRNVEDMAIVIEALAGRDDHDMTSSFNEVPHFYDNLVKAPTTTKVCVYKEIYDLISNEKVKANFDQTIKALTDAGYQVDFVSFDKTLLLAILPTYTIIANSEATSNHSCLDGVKYGTRVAGNTPDEVMINSRTNGFGAHIKRRFILGNLALATENQEKMFRKAQRVRRLIVNEFNRIMNDYDIMLAPCCGHVAARIDDESEDRLTDEYLIVENHLALENFAGSPSLTLPTGYVDDMPLGININGRIFEDQQVLNFAHALEELLPYKNSYKEGK